MINRFDDVIHCFDDIKSVFVKVINYLDDVIYCFDDIKNRFVKVIYRFDGMNLCKTTSSKRWETSSRG